MEAGSGDRRQQSQAGQTAQALIAELTILRHGIVTFRDAANEWLPGLFASLVRVTELVKTSVLKVDRSMDQLTGSLARISAALARIDAQLAEVAAQASSDPLTGLLNRAGLERELERALADAGAQGEPLALVFCDIDLFKEFNDRFGHHIGDQALRLVASALAAYPDPRRIIGRYGGEEFVLVMPGRTAEEALVIARSIAEALGRRVLRVRGTGEILGSLTLSAGVAGWRRPETAADLLRRADAAMYVAKRAGRNRVELAV